MITRANPLDLHCPIGSHGKVVLATGCTGQLP